MIAAPGLRYGQGGGLLSVRDRDNPSLKRAGFTLIAGYFDFIHTILDRDHLAIVQLMCRQVFKCIACLRRFQCRRLAGHCVSVSGQLDLDFDALRPGLAAVRVRPALCNSDVGCSVCIIKYNFIFFDVCVPFHYGLCNFQGSIFVFIINIDFNCIDALVQGIAVSVCSLFLYLISIGLSNIVFRIIQMREGNLCAVIMDSHVLYSILFTFIIFHRCSVHTG